MLILFTYWAISFSSALIDAQKDVGPVITAIEETTIKNNILLIKCNETKKKIKHPGKITIR